MLVPEEYGGSEFGVETAAKIIEATANEGAGANANFFVLTSMMGNILFCESGTDAQKERYLPGLADGEYIMSWGITEPGAGSDTLATGMTAEYDDGGYRINVKKVWTTFAHCSNLLIAVVRTTPLDEVERKTDGISLVALNPGEADNVEINRIEKMPIRATRSNEVFFKDTRMPEDQLIGEPDESWNYLTDLLNVERIGSGALCVGTGNLSLKKATAYANDREVFDQPIGSHQGIQHMLAEAKMNLEMASQMVDESARAYEAGENYEFEANVGGIKAAEYAYEAIDAALETLGGMGFATEQDLERHFRDMRLFRQVPVSPQMVRNYVGQHVLGLPKSY